MCSLEDHLSISFKSECVSATSLFSESIVAQAL